MKSFPERLINWSTNSFKKDSVLYRLSIREAYRCKKFSFILVLVLYPILCLISWIRIIFKKLFFLKPSIIWAPTPILNIVESSKLLNKLGYKSKTLVYTTYFITDAFDYNLKPVLENPAMSQWIPSLLFIWSFLKFDIYHFYYDGGLWYGMGINPKAKWIEFILLRLAGKRIIASAYGADVRTKRRNEMWQPWNLCNECPDGRQCVCDDNLGAKRAKYYREWCNELLAMGDMHDYIFGSNPHFFYWPIDLSNLKFEKQHNYHNEVIIAHSPNHRYFKGTRFIEATVKKLIDEGHKLKLDIIERVPNSEAKQRYANADIIFAQCILGWPGFTEIEGMALAKPVLTNVRDPELYFKHASSWAAVNVNPDTMENILRELVINKDLRDELGKKGRQHVEQFWSYEACATSYQQLHDRVWKNNRLAKTILNKYREYKHGEIFYRSSHLQTPISQYPVTANYELLLARIAWGQFGRPTHENEVLQISVNKVFIHHPGAIAFYAIALFSLQQQCSNDQYGDKFWQQVDWLSEFDFSENKQLPSIDTSLVEFPSFINAYHSLSISAFLRAYQLSNDKKYFTKATVLADFLINSGREKFGNKNTDVINVMTNYFGLYECNHIEEIEEFEGYKDKVADLLSSQNNIFNILPLDFLGCDFKMDEYYYVVEGMQFIGNTSRNKKLVTNCLKMKSELKRARIKNFLRGNMPL